MTPRRRPDYLGWVALIAFLIFCVAALAIGWNAE